MTYHRSRTLFPLVVTGWLAALGPAAADGPVKDGAGLFRPDTIERATERINQLGKAHGVQLLVETEPTLPAEARRYPTLHAWAAERAKAAGLDGVYILITKDTEARRDRESLDVQVVVQLTSKPQAFTPRDGEELSKDLLRSLRRKPLSSRPPAYDQGLLDAVASVQWTTACNLRSSRWTWALWVFLSLVGLWLVAGLLRRSMTKATPAGAVGLLPGLSGGMFGAMTGQWICEYFFRQPAVEASAAEATEGPSPLEREAADDEMLGREEAPDGEGDPSEVWGPPRSDVQT